MISYERIVKFMTDHDNQVIAGGTLDTAIRALVDEINTEFATVREHTLPKPVTIKSPSRVFLSWKCFQTSCPDRVPEEGPFQKLCYTCGELMERVEVAPTYGHVGVLK